MSALSYGQLEGLWIQNGGPPAVAPLMAAIALAESGGDPTAQNNTDNGGTQTSWGLFQVSNGTHAAPAANILDPNVNTKEAVKKYRTQGLTAWGTYTSGAYKRFMRSGVTPSTGGIPVGSTVTPTGAQQASVTGDIGNAIGKGFADAFSAVLQPLINIAIWGTETLLGLAMIVGGVLIVVSKSQGGQQLETKTAEVVAPEAAPEIELVQQERRAKQQAKKATSSGSAPAKKPGAFAATGEPLVDDWGF